MNKLYSFFSSAIISVTHISGMDNTKSIQFIITRTHEYVENIEQARNFLCSISYINKEWNALVNDPTITRNTINNLAKKNYYTNGTIAEKLATSGAKNYITYSKKLYLVDEGTMTKLVSMGADVNYQREHDLSFLNYITCYKSGAHCNLKKMAVALTLGADVNGGKGGYDSPLTFAIKQKNIEKIKLLLEYSPKYKGLYEVVEKGYIEIMDLLLQHGANPNDGLSIALNKNYIQEGRKLLQLFFDKGAIPDHKDLQYAYKETIKNLDVNEKEYYQPYETTDIIELLCKHGAYNENILQQAYATKEKIDRIVNMLEKNKPYEQGSNSEI